MEWKNEYARGTTSDERKAKGSIAEKNIPTITLIGDRFLNFLRNPSSVSHSFLTKALHASMNGYLFIF